MCTSLCFRFPSSHTFRYYLPCAFFRCLSPVHSFEEWMSIFKWHRHIDKQIWIGDEVDKQMDRCHFFAYQTNIGMNWWLIENMKRATTNRQTKKNGNRKEAGEGRPDYQWYGIRLCSSGVLLLFLFGLSPNAHIYSNFRILHAKHRRVWGEYEPTKHVVNTPSNSFLSGFFWQIQTNFFLHIER